MEQDNIRGIYYAFLATGLFSVTAVMAKIAVPEYHVLQILFFRQIVVFLSSLPVLVQTYPASLKTRCIGVHALRLIGAFIALSCSIWAVAVLPLATAVTLGFAQAFFVAILAALVLHEKIGRHRIGAIAVGFVGVLIVMRPGLDGITNWHMLIPLVGSIGAAVAVVSVRKLTQTESTATLLLYQSVFVGLLAAIPLYWLWVTPDFSGLIFLLSMGLVAAVAQWVGIRALRLGEATVVSTIKYTDLIFAAVLGYVIFSEVPDRYTLAGAGIIVCAAIYLFRRENRSRI